MEIDYLDLIDPKAAKEMLICWSQYNDGRSDINIPIIFEIQDGGLVMYDPYGLKGRL